MTSCSTIVLQDATLLVWGFRWDSVELGHVERKPYPHIRENDEYDQKHLASTIVQSTADSGYKCVEMKG